MTSDYLMRQIEDATRALASVVFSKNLNQHEILDEQGQFTQGSLLLHQLRGMVARGELNEAENLLFDTIEADPRDEYLLVALDFYEALQPLSDASLKACGFSRGEIAEGLAAVQRLYGDEGAENL